MPLEAGQTLLHYRLVERIGEGGMGVVWKAHDTTLDRVVAIKVLPEAFATDPDRLGRFRREARTLAALNHPSIAAIFGLHEAGATHFLALEYVEGEDLACRLRRGALAVEEALAVARDVADALSAAHAIGVVHRDLKPANVMLTPDGPPKVLDFGLAKALAPDPETSGSASGASPFSPTVTSLGRNSGAHVILGTAAYMAPEQARGKPVDRRADVWALGGLLYEMLTGIAPFNGETISDTLASVLKTEPAWEALPLATPPAVRRLLRRCLQKDPRQRLHDAADARLELAEALEGTAEEGLEAAPAARRRSPALVAGVAALALIGGAVLGFMLRGGAVPAAATPSSKIVSSLTLPPGVTLDVNELSLAMSPDGEQLAFVGVDSAGRSYLYVRRLDTGAARLLAETEGARTPFWSPDGQELGFHAESRLMRVPAEGGTPRLVTEADGRGGTWGVDGTIVFGVSTSGPLMRVDAGGGSPEPLEQTSLGKSVWPNTPQMLPDGRRFLFAVEDLEGDLNGVYLGRLDSPEVRRLIEGFTNGASADGHLLYTKDGNLLGQSLDPATLAPTGEPWRVAGPMMRLNYPFHGLFAAAHSGGRLVYVEGGETTSHTELVWVDRSGAEIERTGIRGDLYNPRLSHDDRLLALDVSTVETHGDVWIFDLARGSSRRLTQDPIDESRPAWTPDDSEIVFHRLPDLYAVDAEGRSEPRPIYRDEQPKYVHDVSPDGRFVLFVQEVASQTDLRVLDRETGETRDWLVTTAHEDDAQFSPDGGWIAYRSNESGRFEIWVDRFPDRGERFRVSTDGGSNPTWRRDGKELFYVSATNDLMAVPVDMASERSPIGEPQRLFAPRLRRDQFDASADGQRFLLNQRILVEVSSIVLIQHWPPNPG